jgi:non-canonical poly(A) RNA polymerase PAPD5/7
MADTSGFVTGDDFIGFDIPSAGPSRAGTQSLTGSPATSLLSLDDDNNNNLLDALTRSPPRGWKGKGRDDSDLNTPPVSTPPSEPAPPKGMKRKSNGLEPENKRPKNDPHSTGPRNLKEERKAAERAAPWADDVEWDRCVDSSEM